MTKIKSTYLALLAALLSPMAANADLITSAIGATASSTFGAPFDIGNTIDQSGLSAGYVSGVTDFATYLATSPTHTLLAFDNEWFSADGVTAATITYDMGSVLALLNFALWNEEFSGFGTGIITSSLDNVIFSAVTTIFPIDSPFDLDYGAQVFALGVSARYLRLDISGCPQPDGDPLRVCGIGEVAFDVAAVPEPGTLALLGIGLLGMGLSRRRKKI